ncbi:MAG TPA: transglutaminase-like domain-containing protein [Candidatus Binatia bacterium]|nr:transglutaminase-like domain-containing protein [Candidatus Binatia bacterium]
MTHLVSLVLILLAATSARADTIPPTALGARTLRFTYETHVTPPDGAHDVEVWLPLPREDDQRVLDVRLTGTAPATVVRLFPSGDQAAYLRIAAPHGPVTLAATATVARREVRVDATGRDATTAQIDPAIFAAELAPNGAVQINDEVRAIARRETRGKKTVSAQARALYDWVYDHMQYDKSVPGYGLGDIPYCLKVGKGNCTDFHTLFIALARSSGIPARWNMGFPVAYGPPATGEQAVPGYHCWAEFYAPGAGWVPVDISEARKHPELKDYFFGGLSGNRVLFTRARDFLLEPDGTGQRRNYLIYPVARADGADVKADWTFRYEDLPGT